MPTSHVSRIRPHLKFRDAERHARFWLSSLFTVIVICSAACRPVDQTAVENGTQDVLPDQEAWNTTIYLSRHGRQEATIRAGHRLYYSATNVTVMDGGVYVEFYEEDGSLSSTLEAERGDIDGLTHDLRVRGGVTVRSTERGTLETDSLTWVNAENLIETEAAVRLTRETDVLTGDGFEADPGMRRWIIRRDIKGRFLPDVQSK